MADSFPCYLVHEESGRKVASVRQITRDDLPQGEVLIRVAYSSLNYKDALAATGHPGVVKRLPHVPGIDAAGTVEQSATEQFKPGEQVIVTGYELGATHWGGYSRYIRVPADWVVPLPEGLSPFESMALGTAGFTAAQCVLALLEHGLQPADGEVVVTGATGGVGSLSVALLAKQGISVTAVTGKPHEREFLEQLGAHEIVGREAVDDTSGNPLLPARWAGAVDTVGGSVLSTLLRSTGHRGCVAACGLVAGDELRLTVYPFILRGVTLAGIDSAHCPMDRRLEIWSKLAGPWKLDQLTALVKTISLSELDREIRTILAGGQRGRVVVEPVES
ncbi:MAG: oxidoreductase [Pirellulales bacterium]